MSGRAEVKARQGGAGRGGMPRRGNSPKMLLWGEGVMGGAEGTCSPLHPLVCICPPTPPTPPTRHPCLIFIHQHPLTQCSYPPTDHHNTSTLTLSSNNKLTHYTTTPFLAPLQTSPVSITPLQDKDPSQPPHLHLAHPPTTIHIPTHSTHIQSTTPTCIPPSHPHLLSCPRPKTHTNRTPPPPLLPSPLHPPPSITTPTIPYPQPP